MLLKIREMAQAVSRDTVGKVSVTIGGGGSTAQYLMEWTDLFIKFGNAALILGGLYLMCHKVFNKSNRRNRREGDS